MGKISKNANIYDLQGNLLRHVGEDGKLHNYTTEELEELVDKLTNDKDENGNVKDPNALNNANAMLFQYYQKYGNPHESELKEMLEKYKEKKTTEEEVQQKLKETASDLDEQQHDDNTNTVETTNTDEHESVIELDEDGSGVYEAVNKTVTPEDMDHYIDFEEVA